MTLDQVVPHMRGLDAAGRKALLDRLLPQERQALQLRFGWGVDRLERTRAEVGQAMGVPTKRANAITESALRKLLGLLSA